MKRLQIAYTCNDKMFNGVYLSILSIVKRTKTPIDFYVFSANLKELNRKYISFTKEHIHAISKIINKYSPASTFTIIDCKKQYYQRTGKKALRTRQWTPYAVFRLLFDMFNQIRGLMLYLDPDTMVCGDVAKAFDVNMKNFEICVTRDIFEWDNKLKGKYFNSGVILMNIDKIRKTGLLNKAFKYMLEKRPKFCDQDALNNTAIFVKYRENDAFNRIWRERIDTTLIKHFAGNCPKPWKKNFQRNYDKYNYRIWESDIEEWKEMKSKL